MELVQKDYNTQQTTVSFPMNQGHKIVSRKIQMCCAMGREDGPPWVWMNLILLKLQKAEVGDGDRS